MFKNRIVKFSIKYNTSTFNLKEPDNELKCVKEGLQYKTENFKENDHKAKITYDNICILTNEILHNYVILQHIFKKETLIDLSKYNWDFNKWKVEITSGKKKTPSWIIILNYLLNLKEFGKPFKIQPLNKTHPLPDMRGWTGERPRQVSCEKGFPYYTKNRKKFLNQTERLFECPFPICQINPKRKAYLDKNASQVKKCFTCGVKEGEKDKFGYTCNFEKAHLEPHILKGDNTCGYQCKWCNTFYKDKITWNKENQKPKFNIYAILRDGPKSQIIKHLKSLGFTSKDLE